MRVLIVAGDTDGNLGDRAIFAATVDLLRRIDPSVVVQTVSSAPDEMSNELKIGAMPRGISATPALLQSARAADLIIIGGGGLFQDDDSLVKMPYWASRTAMLRAFNKKVIGWSLGVGPLRAPSSQAAARFAFSCMASLSVRDRRAASVATPLTKLPVSIVPDPAICLEPRSPEEARNQLKAAGVDLNIRPIVGVALRRWFPARARIVPHKISARLGVADDGDKATSHLLSRRIAEALDCFVAEQGGQVLLMPSYALAHEGDFAMARQVESAMSSNSVTLLQTADPRMYKAICGQLDLMIGGRMHPTILASGMSTRVCGLAYNPKFQGFFSHLGTDDLVLDVAAMLADDGAKQLRELISRASQTAAPAKEKVLEMQETVRRQLLSQVR